MQFRQGIYAFAAGVVSVLLALSAGTASAQAQRPECKRLLGLVTTAPMAALSSRELHTCGPDGAAALAGFVRRAAIQSDSSYLFQLDVATDEASLRPVLDAAVEVVRTRSAALPSRIAAIQIAVRQVYGRDSYLSGDLTDPDRRCRMRRGGAEQISGAAAALQQLAKSLSDDWSEQMPLRQAGLCIVRQNRYDYSLAEDVSQIHVTVRCESFYSIQNDLDHPVTVRIEEPNSNGHFTIRVTARGVVAHFVSRPGTTRFFSADELIAAVPSSTKRCERQP